MLFGKYEFNCEFERQAVLPYFKGSTFRGVLGHALKKVVCALKNQECNTCLLNKRCIYTLVFETPLAMKAPDDTRVVSPPHPFVIEPPVTTQTHFSKNASFDFNLLLFGEINKNIPYFVYASDRMGQIGFGKKVKGRRGQFFLKSIKTEEKLIYTDEDQILKMPDLIELTYPEESNNHPDSPFRLTLTLETPLRLKFENRLISDLPFHILVRAMLRKVSSHLSCYGDQSPSIDYQGLVKEAHDVRIEDNRLKWFDWKRYSGRQDKNMLMGGMVGSITYDGMIGHFLNLIDFCSKVHIGKQTAFGLGKFSVE